MRFAFLAAGAGGVGCIGPPQHNDAEAVSSHMGGIISLTKVGSMLVAVLNGFTWLLQFAAGMLFTFFGAVGCEMAWLMSELAELGGSAGQKLFKKAALFVS